MTFQSVITQAFVDQFLRLIAFFESQSGLFSTEKGFFQFEQLYILTDVTWHFD